MLADPVRRAIYDREMFGTARAERVLPTDALAVNVDRRVENELQLRQGLLQALYTLRRNQPNNPGLSLMALRELLGCSTELMQFTLWYLRGKKLIDTVDGEGNVAITVLGVDHVEGNGGPTDEPDDLVSDRSRRSGIKSLSWTSASRPPMP